MFLLRVVVCFFSSRRRHTRCALVTGVQTCALPIFDVEDDIVAGVEQRARFGKPGAIATTEHFGMFEEISARNLLGETGLVDEVIEIGRASCRERVCQYV